MNQDLTVKEIITTRLDDAIETLYATKDVIVPLKENHYFSLEEIDELEVMCEQLDDMINFLHSMIIKSRKGESK